MNLKLSILLDWLQEYKPQIEFCDDSTKNIEFEDICIYYPEIDQLKHNVLYMCFHGCVPLKDDLDKYFFVISQNDQCSAKTNYIRVFYQMNELTFYEVLRGCFRRFYRWQRSLDNALIGEEPIQKLFDISEEILPNEMILIDGFSNYLAGSRSISEEDEIYYSIVKNGKVDPERAMTIITDVKYNKKIRFGDDEYYFLSDDVFGYPEIFWNYKYNGFVRASLFSKFSHKPRTQGYIDLFCAFLCKLKKALNREQMKNSYYEMSDYPYQLLMEGKDVEIAAKMIHCLIEGEFTVVAVDQDWDLERIDREMDYVMHVFHSMLANVRSFTWQEKNYLLLSYEGQNRDRDEYWTYQENSLEYVLEKLKSTCGLSQRFYSLRQLKHGCIQAKKALELSKEKFFKTDSFAGERKDSRILRYRNMGIYHVIETFFENHPAECYFCPALLELWNYDKEHHTKYCEILRRYLVNDRKINIVAKEMFMHRNNVVYHLNRIKEKFGIDYNDKDGKMYLLFCVFASEYLDSQERL